jgi:molybdate transport system permease protein
MPAGMALPAAAGVMMVVLPLVALLLRAPWSDLGTAIQSAEVQQAMLLSAECSLGALAVSLFLGVPLAWVLARSNFPGLQLVRAVVALPMVLPPVVGGVALLYAFGRRGLLGSLLQGVPGFPAPFTTGAVVLAEAFVAMPFLVITVEAGLRQVDHRYEEAAATLGAAPWRRFWTVTMPLAAPSVGAGAALCWARALGEFGATITFAGNLPGRTQTMPTAIYVLLESNPDHAVAVALVMLATSFAVLLAVRVWWSRTG